MDGRHARRDRNRTAVLDAALALFHGGDLEPRPEAIAEKAGVSLRSLYRYFPDVDALYRAAMDHNLMLLSPRALIADVGEGTLQERIDRCVETRMDLYEGLAATIRIARMAEYRSELVRTRYANGRKVLCDEMEHHFATELAHFPPSERAGVAGALDVLCQLETLHYLRVTRGLSRKEATEVMATGLAALLDR